MNDYKKMAEQLSASLVLNIDRDKKKHTRRQHRVCPVCRYHKTFAGACCKECVKIGYKLQVDGKVRRKI